MRHCSIFAIKLKNLFAYLRERLIGEVSMRDRFLVGVALYWAEDSKEKDYSPGLGVIFSNSDSRMVNFFVLWLTGSCGVDRADIAFEVFIHNNSEHRLPEVRQFWSKVTGFPESAFTKIYFKKHRPKTKRKNVGPLYYGLLRVKVKKSSQLNRSIQGWISGILKASNI